MREAGCGSSYIMNMETEFYNSLDAFATREEIVSLVAKASVKYYDKARKAADGERRAPVIDAELFDMIPADFRFKSGGRRGHCSALKNYMIHRLDELPSGEMSSDEKIPSGGNLSPDASILKLNSFVGKVQGIARSGDFVFETPRIIPQLKDDSAPGKIVYRPLSAYSDFTTKIVLALEAEYLSRCFDPYFHTEMLAYRRPREYHGRQGVVTTNKDAVTTIMEYLSAHKDEKIYVSECDIRKFFDILKHSVILDCFDKMVLKVTAEHPEFDAVNARKILVSFLNSYSFYHNVFSFNKKAGEESEFWRNALSGHYDAGMTYSFGWISKAAAVKNSDFDDFRDLGIPQGAALSPVLANIVLQSVDEQVLGTAADPDRLFVRYCDDMILMHTNFVECRRLRMQYATALDVHKLEYHDFKCVGELSKRGKSPQYWKAKSKEPFLWGRSSGNSAEWIGFLGFEFRCSGDVRMRRSSVGKKADKMRRDMLQIHFGANGKLRERHLKKFRSMTIAVPKKGSRAYNLLSSHLGITANPWTARQIRGLKKFRRRFSEFLRALPKFGAQMN